MLKNILAISLIANSVFAVDIKTQFLPQGTISPFSGYLFTTTDAAQAAQDKQALPIYKQLNQSLQISLDNEIKNTSDEKAKNVILQSDLTAAQKAEHDEKVMTNWEKALYFGLGVVVTGLAIDGAYKISQTH